MLNRLRPVDIFNCWEFERALSHFPRQYLLTFLLLRGESLEEVKKFFGVSEDTIRREVARIGRKGKEVCLPTI